MTSPRREERYRLATTRTVRRAVHECLPEAVAAAVIEFIKDLLIDNPYRVGKRLGPPLRGSFSVRRGEYRIIYRVGEHTRTVTVTSINHRDHSYRTHR